MGTDSSAPRGIVGRARETGVDGWRSQRNIMSPCCADKGVEPAAYLTSGVRVVPRAGHRRAATQAGLPARVHGRRLLGTVGARMDHRPRRQRPPFLPVHSSSSHIGPNLLVRSAGAPRRAPRLTCGVRRRRTSGRVAHLSPHHHSAVRTACSGPAVSVHPCPAFDQTLIQCASANRLCLASSEHTPETNTRSPPRETSRATSRRRRGRASVRLPAAL